jgi:hypothetical protein
MPWEKVYHVRNVFLNIHLKCHPNQVKITFTIAWPNVVLGLHIDICPLGVKYSYLQKVFCSKEKMHWKTGFKSGSQIIILCRKCPSLIQQWLWSLWSWLCIRMSWYICSSTWEGTSETLLWYSVATTRGSCLFWVL